MPSMYRTIDALPLSDKMKIVKYLVAAIEDAVSKAEACQQSKKRCLVSDPALHCEIKCDLFEDSSSDWESA